ncbi:MAG: helix-turn-helix domain-containing protein [Geodermatophilaceae bacterium]
MRTALGRRLRSHREGQRRTLRDVSGSARVSLGYLSEIERGQKEASSELLSSICDALDLELADLLSETSDDLRTPAGSTDLLSAQRLVEAPVLKAVDSLIAA